MATGVRLAIIGATGAVGTAMLEILAERKFPIAALYVVASERSKGKYISFNEKNYRVEVLEQFDFHQVQLALFAAGSDVAEAYAPIAARSGCLVIDNSSYYRYFDDVPLIVPEVNPEALKLVTAQQRIIANPNCSTIQMLVALKPIYDAVGIKRINVATYQAVSGAGEKAITELAKQTSCLLNGLPIEPHVYPYQIAFNVLPHIDDFADNGYTREEMKMLRETRKIFADDAITVNPTAVRVPVFFGHSEALHIETGKKITAKQARLLLEKAPGVTVIDDIAHNQYPTAITHGAGKNNVYVGRIREDISHKKGLNLWVVADNIRKGAALNAIQIAELLVVGKHRRLD